VREKKGGSWKQPQTMRPGSKQRQGVKEKSKASKVFQPEDAATIDKVFSPKSHRRYYIGFAGDIRVGSRSPEEFEGQQGVPTV